MAGKNPENGIILEGYLQDRVVLKPGKTPDKVYTDFRLVHQRWSRDDKSGGWFEHKPQVFLLTAYDDVARDLAKASINERLRVLGYMKHDVSRQGQSFTKHIANSVAFLDRLDQSERGSAERVVMPFEGLLVAYSGAVGQVAVVRPAGGEPVTVRLKGQAAAVAESMVGSRVRVAAYLATTNPAEMLTRGPTWEAEKISPAPERSNENSRASGRESGQGAGL